MNRKGLLVLVLLGLVISGAVLAFASKSVKTQYIADFRVGNLTCGACAEKIREAVRVLDREAEVQIDLATGLARVIYDGSRTDATAIAGRITEAGYPTVVSRPFSETAPVPFPGSGGCPAAKPVKQSGCGGSCCS